MRSAWRVYSTCMVVGALGFLVGSVALTAAAHGSRAGGRTLGSARSGWASMPLSARGPVSAALGFDARGYRIRAADGGFRAVGVAQGLRAWFGPAGMRLSSGRSVVGLRLDGIGYRGSRGSVSAVEPSARANRVTYARRGVEEWYVNGPAGIEQGFDVARPPARRGAGPLTLSLMVSGNLHASLARGGKELVLDRAGRAVLAYRDLAASDASGRALPARLALSGRRLSIMVDARGARYPLRIDPLVQQAKLTASDGVAGNGLGSAVAMSGDGSTIVAGAPGGAGNPNSPGAVYVFHKPAAGWSAATQTAKLTATGGAAGDSLGYSVAISGDGSTIAAGARKVNLNTGAAYVFVRSGSAWTSGTQTAELTDSAGDVGHFFGWSVAVSGDGSTVVAGAPYANSQAGAGYVFARPGPGWGNETQTATLTARFRLNDPDPAYDLGWSSAISADGSTIVLGASGQTNAGNIGAQGGAYVYVKPQGAWANANETARLTASDGGVHDLLGTSVATSSDGSVVAAGAPSTLNPGADYVFVRPALGGWADAAQSAKLTASDGAARDFLGASLAMSFDGSIVATGAFTAAVSGSARRGALYTFAKPASGWASEFEAQKLIASDGVTNDELGVAIGMASDASSVVAGAAAVAGGTGAAYEFGSGSTTGPFPLTVSVSPSGQGSVSSQPDGISCPGSCSASYSAGTSVTLTATPATGFRFAAWSGDCAGTATAVCTLAMSQARTATASFTDKTPTKLTLSCSYSTDAVAEVCNAAVVGGSTPPTGQVVFQGSGGAGFPSGNSCTLDAGAGCQVRVLPPTADLLSPHTVGLSATYNGDTTHAPSGGTAQFGTAALISAIEAGVKQSCEVMVVDLRGGGLTSFGAPASGTWTANMTVGVADVLGLIPSAPGSSSAVGDNGTVDSTCTIDSSAASAAANSAPLARTAKCKPAKRKHKCPPAPVVIGQQKKTLAGGHRYKLRVPLTAAGRRAFKLLKAADKAYRKHHHGKHLKPPRLRIKVTVTYKLTR